MLVDRRLRQRHPLGQVLLVGAVGDRALAALLVGHPGGDEPGRGHGVAVAHVEEVVDVAVEVVDALALELLGHRGAVDVVDPVDRLVGDLVIDGIGVRREEVARAAHLVRVDEQRAGVLAQQLELGVGLGLGAGEPVAVEVEAVEVAARVSLAPVGVLDREQDDDRVGEDPVRGAVAAVGELVEHPQRPFGPRLLAAVDVGGDPEDRRIALRDRIGPRAAEVCGSRSVWAAALISVQGGRLEPIRACR